MKPLFFFLRSKEAGECPKTNTGIPVTGVVGLSSVSFSGARAHISFANRQSSNPVIRYPKDGGFFLRNGLVASEPGLYQKKSAETGSALR